MTHGKANIFASEIAPNPKEVKYWADLRADSHGKVLKVYVDGRWEPIVVTGSNGEDISYELLKNKPMINGVMLSGNVSLETLDIQSASDMDRFVEDDELASLIPGEYVTESELLSEVYTKVEVDTLLKSSGSNSWIEV